ncbi:MAG: isocitrate lyase/PEP mutase family protein [Pseudomonadota bacterium]
MTETPALKSRLQQPRILTVPGIFDALSALLAEQAGFEAAFLSGSAVAYSQLGRPDVGLVTVNEMADVCARITDRVAMPILADVDSGFGNAAHAARAIRMLEQAGAAGVQVEDQVPVKRANDLKGRPLICPDAMVDKIKAMADARRSDSMLISARTDSSAASRLK